MLTGALTHLAEFPRTDVIFLHYAVNKLDAHNTINGTELM